jgi:D-alanine-D-alanine ligase
MYPKLWRASGLSYGGLIERLIELAEERHTAEEAKRSTVRELDGS